MENEWTRRSGEKADKEDGVVFEQRQWESTANSRVVC